MKKGEIKFYLRKQEREYLKNGLEFMINKCYPLKDFKIINKERFIPLEDINDREFYFPTPKIDEVQLNEEESFLIEKANFRPFPLIFEEVNEEKVMRRRELEEKLKELEEKKLLYKQILPSQQNILLNYIKIYAETYKDKNLIFEFYPGKFKYKIGDENPVFLDSLLYFLSEFPNIIDKIENFAIEEEVNYLFGPPKKQNIEEKVNNYFITELEEIYKKIEDKYKPTKKQETVESSIFTEFEELQELQLRANESEEAFIQFEKKFEEILKAVENGNYNEGYAQIIVTSDGWNELKKISSYASRLAEVNTELYNDLAEIYYKVKSGGENSDNLMIFFNKKKKDLTKIGRKLEIELLKNAIKDLYTFFRKK